MGHILAPAPVLVFGASVATLRRLKMKNSFKDDIEKAERNILIFSWLSIFATMGVLACGIWGIL